MSRFTASLLVVLVATLVTATFARTKSSYLINAVPDGYHLQFYDDCGVPKRQPHVKADGGIYTFSTDDVQASEKDRTVACGIHGKITANYDHLDATQRYVLAITYANEPNNHRAQSLWAGDIQLHRARELPKGKSERLIFTLPKEAIKDGKLNLEFRLEGEVNVVVSNIELWSPAPSPSTLYLEDVSGLNDDLCGSVLKLDYEPAVNANVEVKRVKDQTTLAKLQTGPDGTFAVKRAALGADRDLTDIKLTVTSGDARVETTIPRSSLVFEPIKYRPLPSAVAGLKQNKLSLDGTWRIQTQNPQAARKQPLDGGGWGDLKIPGQWVQQGYDVPENKPVAMARQFDVPAEWKDDRIFIRFDSIHAGTRYWINGTEIGKTENLFMPVELDITDAVHAGQSNRIDLEMKVDTISERLSYSSGYAMHNLGGIDRSVSIYVLPQTHIRSLRIATDLDKDYRNGKVILDFGMIAAKPEADGLELSAKVLDNSGNEIAHSTTSTGKIENETPVHLEVSADDPKKWSDEKPNLYTLAIDLKRGPDVLEHIERRIGFRKIEIRDRQIYVNGQRIKLAGVCRHETDPLTGRADTMKYAEADLKLVKDANMNYVRTSHYPPPQELLDAADRLGIYVEVEAPFCWVGNQWDMSCARQVLTPTSAMIDYCHWHPSVLIWSLANESQYRPFFDVSNRLCKQLDPTRPTTFNNDSGTADPRHMCDVANLHYPQMPFDQAVSKGDTRPILLDEYFFPVCHEQHDVRADPGLRELWGAGHAEPDSDWGKKCAQVFANPPSMTPGEPSGFWPYIYKSDSLAGGAIWALLDEPFYLPGGKHVGYYWVHGPWGLVDAWRRPKPEWWLAKMIFSPVWFPQREADWSPGQKTIRLPVQNRYAFTNLNELKIDWEFAGQKGRIKADVSPATTGAIEVPIPDNAKPGDSIVLRVTDSTDRLVNVLPIRLGPAVHEQIPSLKAGVPEIKERDGLALISGKNFRLVIDEKTGQLKSDDARYQSPILRRPEMHVSHFDFGDFRDAPAYGMLEDEGAHQVDQVHVEKQSQGALIEIQDRYPLFNGSIKWLIDCDGMSEISFDYTYSGDELFAREIGVRMALRPECQTLKWRRWSEWGIYPDDSISRTEGTATAHRDAKWPRVAENVRPTWPWSQDETEQGTADFRSVKLNIYEASLADAVGKGVSVYADADAHVRPCLYNSEVLMHVLSECKLGPVTLKKGDHVSGKFHVRIQSE